MILEEAQRIKELEVVSQGRGKLATPGGLQKGRKGAPREVSWAWEEGLAINWSRDHGSSFVI